MIVRDFDPDDLDGDDEDWGEDPDEDPTAPCPHCGAEIFDDAERCPECGRYLSREDAPRRQPWWVVAGVLASLGMVAWWILHP